MTSPLAEHALHEELNKMRLPDSIEKNNTATISFPNDAVAPPRLFKKRLNFRLPTY